MAQAEDTELRDLVIEALEKNGSLAKIRALLRANIFLAFEDNYESIRQNVNLDNVLKLPEGILALSIVYDFLEFCNLKNTLFVYKSETRHEKEYKHEIQKALYDKLELRHEGNKEPVLLSLIKNIKSHQRHCTNKAHNLAGKIDNNGDNNYKDEQNCTYIVHEDTSSSTSNSHSDNSSDEKTKLHLRLQLDNSDTDTSSDSTRDKSSSEYIPSEHIVQMKQDNNSSKHSSDNVITENQKNLVLHSSKPSNIPYFLNELKLANNSSSDSTSYAEVKPFKLTDEKLLITTGIPIQNENYKSDETNVSPIKHCIDNEDKRNGNEVKINLVSPLHSVSSGSIKNDVSSSKERNEKMSLQLSEKSESATAEYSYDFSMSGASKNKDNDPQMQSPPSIQEDIVKSVQKIISQESLHNNSQSSQSSVSISDVADLISEKSLSIEHSNNDNNVSINKLHSISKSQFSNKSPQSVKSLSNESEDFSESPIPSLSNLSLDIHSD